MIPVRNLIIVSVRTKLKEASGVFCANMVSIRLKAAFYNVIVKPTIICSSLAVDRKMKQRTKVAEIRRLRNKEDEWLSRILVQ